MGVYSTEEQAGKPRNACEIVSAAGPDRHCKPRGNRIVCVTEMLHFIEPVLCIGPAVARCPGVGDIQPCVYKIGRCPRSSAVVGAFIYEKQALLSKHLKHNTRLPPSPVRESPNMKVLAVLAVYAAVVAATPEIDSIPP
jgi:hypothetical protein